MIVTRVVRPTFRIERDLVWHNDDHTRTQHVVRTFLSEWSAYLCAARWMIFARRDALKDEATGVCNACCAEEKRAAEEVASRDPSDLDPLYVSLAQCRYHDRGRFDVLAKRLARWLRWRDRKEAASV